MTTTTKSIKRGGLFAGLFLALLLLSALPAAARISLVTVPSRDQVQLTIYNSADITLVRERRVLTLAEGSNRLEFSWANTLIDPTSVNLEILSHRDTVELIDVSFPPQAPNALVWSLESTRAGEVELEITYFTSGLSWSADYAAILAPAEQTMDLTSTVTVINNSGEDYAEAQVRLVVGTIHLVERIEELANRRKEEPIPAMVQQKFMRSAAGYEMAESDAMEAARPPEIMKEGLSEYFLYTIEGKQTVPDGWRKKLISFNETDVPVEAFYKVKENPYALRYVSSPNEMKQTESALRHIRLKNDAEHKLGEVPLPDGTVRTYRRNEKGRLSYWGEAYSKYIPVGEEWEIDLGPDAEVSFESILWEYQKDSVEFDSDGDVSGYDEHRTYRLTIANTRPLPVTIRVDRYVGEESDVRVKDGVSHERYDKDTLRFERRMNPGERLEIEYTVTTHAGTRGNR